MSKGKRPASREAVRPKLEENKSNASAARPLSLTQNNNVAAPQPLPHNNNAAVSEGGYPQPAAIEDVYGGGVYLPDTFENASEGGAPTFGMESFSTLPPLPPTPNGFSPDRRVDFHNSALSPIGGGTISYAPTYGNSNFAAASSRPNIENLNMGGNQPTASGNISYGRAFYPAPFGNMGGNHQPAAYGNMRGAHQPAAYGNVDSGRALHYGNSNQMGAIVNGNGNGNGNGNVYQAPFDNVFNVGGIPYLRPFENINMGMQGLLAPPSHGIGDTFSYTSQQRGNNNTAALPGQPIGYGSNGGAANLNPPIGNNNELDYCNKDGSDLKISHEDLKSNDDDSSVDDDSGDDDDGENKHTYSKENKRRFKAKLRREVTEFVRMQSFMLTYARGDNKSPAVQIYVGWEDEETEGEEYEYPVFWLERTEGDTAIKTRVHGAFKSTSFNGIAARMVYEYEPQYEPRDHLVLYHIYHKDNPPQFDQREALKKHVIEVMQTGDFVALAANQSDDSVEYHKVTNNKHKTLANAINGQTLKVFHITNPNTGGLGEVIKNMRRDNKFKLKAVGKDCRTVYWIYMKE